MQPVGVVVVASQEGRGVHHPHDRLPRHGHVFRGPVDGHQDAGLRREDDRRRVVQDRHGRRRLLTLVGGQAEGEPVERHVAVGYRQHERQRRGEFLLAGARHREFGVGQRDVADIDQAGVLVNGGHPLDLDDAEGRFLHPGCLDGHRGVAPDQVVLPRRHLGLIDRDAVAGVEELSRPPGFGGGGRSLRGELGGDKRRQERQSTTKQGVRERHGPAPQGWEKVPEIVLMATHRRYHSSICIPATPSPPLASSR